MLLLNSVHAVLFLIVLDISSISLTRFFDTKMFITTKVYAINFFTPLLFKNICNIIQIKIFKKHFKFWKATLKCLVQKTSFPFINAIRFTFEINVLCCIRDFVILLFLSVCYFFFCYTY